MAASSRAQVLRLYRALLRESQRFSCYGYRTYAIRRIKDAFRENKNITDSEKIEELLNKAKANLQVIQRQGWEEEPWEVNPFVWKWLSVSCPPAEQCDGRTPTSTWAGYHWADVCHRKIGH
ncbi:LYR motif-containing protein 4 isoform X2 [Agelaius tricolor]|uniref:LYR motif-containing protein 4 isoform X2 n=1 Tax=Agelaius tricolor TaxID=9191 RepID=UPI0039F1C7CF